MEKFNKDFEYFWDLINDGKNFAFTRYADGEVLLMLGNAVGSMTQAAMVDKWTAPLGLTKVGRELIATLNHTEDNYYYAISSVTDNIGDYNFLKSNIRQKEENITFVNLWINGNYNKSIEKYNTLKKSVNLICNYKAKREKFPFKISSITPFPNDCINFWDVSGETFIESLLLETKDKQNELFFISCGPISEIIIHKLYESNPNNTYIDVGSSIDEFVHAYKTRPYMNLTSDYSKMISKF
jgi:hypothetical protein